VMLLFINYDYVYLGFVLHSIKQVTCNSYVECTKGPYTSELYIKNNLL